VQRLSLQDVATRADCLDDRFFHGASLEIARSERAKALTDDSTRAYIYSGLPPVGAPPLVPVEPPGGEDEPFSPTEGDNCGLSGFCTGDPDLSRILDGDGDGRPDDGVSQKPPRCHGIPGEHCQ
jgi:hypothetical protein